MALYKDKAATDNQKRHEKMCVCPDCDHPHAYPLNGRTHCEVCGAHGLVPSDVIVCGKCFRSFTHDDYTEHREVCEV
jgi:hypothetical protein